MIHWLIPLKVVTQNNRQSTVILNISQEILVITAMYNRVFWSSLASDAMKSVSSPIHVTLTQRFRKGRQIEKRSFQVTCKLQR